MTTNNQKTLEEAEAALEAAKAKAYTSGQDREDAIKAAEDKYNELKGKADKTTAKSSD